MKISKQRLKEIIKEELSTVREGEWYDEENETIADKKFRDSQLDPGQEGDTFAMSLDQLTDHGHASLSQLDKGLSDFQSALARLVDQYDAGEFVNIGTHANMLQAKLDEIKEQYVSALAQLENR
jgi:hypothetical protein